MIDSQTLDLGLFHAVTISVIVSVNETYVSTFSTKGKEQKSGACVTMLAAELH